MRSWDKYCEDTKRLGYPVSYLFNKSKSIDNA